jgi:hypothetical protein
LSTSTSQRGRTGETRRAFLRGSASLVGTLGVAGSFEALWMRAAGGAPRSPSAGYGELTHVTDENTGLDLLKLPRGFRYVSFGWTGDPMSDETPMPSKHDGMAVIAAKSGEVVLCRNHGSTSRASRSAGRLSPTISRGRPGASICDSTRRRGS